MQNLQPIELEQSFSVSPQIIWSCLTELHHLNQWFFQELNDFNAELNFRTAFSIEFNGKKFTHCWEIRQIVPQNRLVLGWQYKEYSGDSEVIFDLSTTPQGCLVQLNASILDPFPDMEEFTQKKHESGMERPSPYPLSELCEYALEEINFA